MEGGHRHGRLQQLIEEELAGLFRDEVTDPRLDGLRVSGVELSPDYRTARVRYVIVADAPNAAAPDLPKIERALDRATPFLRARLGEALELKRLPELVFKHDRDSEAQARAARLLGE